MRHLKCFAILLILVLTSACFGQGLGDSPAVVVHKEIPLYPRIAQKAGIEGTVILSVPLDIDGQPGEPQVIQTPHPLLSKAATRAVKRSTFKAALVQGYPVASSIQLTYAFVCQRDSSGRPVIRPARVQPPRSETVRIRDNQVCLYGHWLSGDIEVLQIENRVYVDGIRVYLPLYDGEIRAGFSDRQKLEELKEECEFLQRDLHLLGKPWEIIESEVYRLISDYPALVDVEKVAVGIFRLSLGEEELEIEMLRNFPPFDYENKQERGYLGKAQGQYVGWIEKLESGSLILFSQFVSRTLGSKNEVARTIEKHMARAAAQGRSPVFSALDLEDLDLNPELKGVLLEPAWVFRR